MIQAYKLLKLMPEIYIVQIKNKLNTPAATVTLNFIYKHSIIGEI